MSTALIIRGRLSGTGEARNISARMFEPLQVSEAPAAPSHDFH